MEDEKLKKKEKDFENGRGRHGGERKKMLLEVQGRHTYILIVVRNGKWV